MMTTLKMHSFQSDNVEVPRIYVFCLSAHEYGLSHGVWINAAKPAEEIQEEIEELLADSPIPDASGFSIGDYEGFYSVTIDQDDCIKRVSEIALFIEEHEALGAGLINSCGSVECAKEALKKRYQGAYANPLAYAIRLFDEQYLPHVPANIRYYVDYAKFKRDIFVDQYFSVEADGSSHVFSYR